MKIEILAYTAGITDGEGYIGIRKGKPKPNRKNFSYDLTVAIAMTDKNIIEWIYDNFGGGSCFSKLRNPQHKSIYRWAIWNNEAEIFLRKIQPFVRVKSKQIEVGLLLCKSIKEGRNLEHKKGVPLEMLCLRENLYLQMRQLNKRGM
jgi:hypothetical protein